MVLAKKRQSLQFWMFDKNVQSNEQGLNHSLMNCTVILGEKNALFLTLNPFSNGQQTKSLKAVQNKYDQGTFNGKCPSPKFLAFERGWII